MDRLKEYRGWLAVICIAVATLVSVQLFITNAEAVSHKVFFVCNNAKSPSVAETLIAAEPCCQGKIETLDLTASNLMKSLKTVTEAFRDLTRQRNSQLEGPERVEDKMDCYMNSIMFIVDNARTFPPKQNEENSGEYYRLFDHLVMTAAQTRATIITKKSNRYLLTYGYYQNTCGECHKKFR